MSLKEIKSKKLYKEYSLVIPFDEIDKETNQKIESIIPTISLPGFRKGKAPLSIVKKKYEDSVLNEVIQNIVNSRISSLIKEKKYNLFRSPKIDLKKFEKNSNAEIEIKIDLQPDIKLKDFKKMKLNNYEINFSKKNIEDQYNKFIKSQKNFKKIEKNRIIKKNDKVIIDFSTLNKEVPEYLYSQKNVPIDTGLDQEFLPGINKELISKLKEGDKKTIYLNLSKMLKNENLNKVNFEVEIKSIEENIKFEVTEEYLKNNGFKNEQELKDLILNNSKQQFLQGIKQIEKKQLMDLLDKEYDFDLPEGVLEEDYKEIWNRIEQAKKNDSLDDDDKVLTEDKLKKRYKKISERRVKLGAIMQFIAKKDDITVSQEELSRGIMQYASQYPGQEKQIMEHLKKSPSSVESIRGPLLEDKIINSIISKVTKTSKKINEEEYKKLEEDTFDIKRNNK